MQHRNLVINALKFGIMEIKSINIRGCEVSAIFTGRAYYFTSNFYGLLCVATEINESEDGRAFSVVTGNHHTDGTRLANSVVSSAAKKYIRKEENKYINKVVTFVDGVNRDLAADYITIQYEKR